METIYQFQDDTSCIKQMQRESMGSSEAGLKITHGLIGSSEWWRNIQDGKLKVWKLSGSVSGFWPGQYGSGPAEFEILDTNGEASTWLCGLEPIEAASAFRIGRWVELEYVWQELKTTFNGTPNTKLCLSIRLS